MYREQAYLSKGLLRGLHQTAHYLGEERRFKEEDIPPSNHLQTKQEDPYPSSRTFSIIFALQQW